MTATLALLLLLAVGGVGVLLASRKRQVELTWLALHWPRPVEPAACLALLRQLAADRRLGPVVIETVATAGALSYRIGVASGAVVQFTSMARGVVPGLELTPTAPPSASPRAWRLLLSTRQRALRRDDPIAITRGLLSALAATGRDEVVTVQWLLGPRRAPSPVSADTTTANADSLWSTLWQSGNRKLDTERRSALIAKRSEQAFTCLARVGVETNSKERTRALLSGLLAALRTAEAPGVRLSLRRESGASLAPVMLPRLNWPLTLNVAELVGLLAWPFGAEPLPGLPAHAARLLRADPKIAGNARVIARSTAPGDERELGLSPVDALQHLFLLGPTGTGKSTVLLNLAAADIAAGYGTIVIDPKGDLIEALLARIPRERIADVVVLDPADESRPVGLNLLAAGGRHPELVADEVLAIFHGVWADSWGPRLQDVLHASLLSLAGQPGMSLCALPLILSNPSARRRLLGKTVDPVALGPFWAWYDSLSEEARAQVIAPVMSRLRAFLLRPRMRAVLGQSAPRFSVDQVFTGRKVLLVSLAKGQLGSEASALMGSAVVAACWHATLERASVPAGKRRPVFVYVDEASEYIHLPTSLSDALAQARGYGVSFTLANQHLGQWPSDTRAAVMANARSKVCFQLPAEDAAVMARSSGGELTSDDFQQLGRYEAYLRLVADGQATGFASGRSLPPAAVCSDPRAVRRASRERYGTPLDEVEAEIARLYTPDELAEPARGRRPRSSS